MVPTKRSPLNNAILVVMLASLALAALMGVMAIFASTPSGGLPLVCTAILVAGSCALMFYILRLLDAEKTRRTGILAMVLLGVEFLLTVFAIWAVQFQQASLGFLSFEFFVFGAIACRMFHSAQIPEQRLAGWAGLGITTAALGVAAFSLTVITARGSAIEEYQAVAWMLLGTAIVVVCNLFGAGTDRRHWRWIGALSALAGAVLFANCVAILRPGVPAWVAMTLTIVVGVLSGQANMLLRVPLVGGQRILLGVTLAVGWIMGLCITLGAANQTDNLFFQCAGAAGIITAAGTLAVIVQGRFNRKIGPPTAAVVQFAEMGIICPFCKKNLTVATGDSACSGCGLGFSIKVQEPRCANCDYLLLSLQSDKCPECGTPVPFRASPPMNAVSASPQ